MADRRAATSVDRPAVDPERRYIRDKNRNSTNAKSDRSDVSRPAEFVPTRPCGPTDKRLPRVGNHIGGAQRSDSGTVESPALGIAIMLDRRAGEPALVRGRPLVQEIKRGKVMSNHPASARHQPGADGFDR
jgi:hypothetical protein